LKFDPKLPAEGSNVTPTHPLREALVLVLGVIGAAIASVASIGVIVDFVAPRIPPSAEVAAFSGWFDDEEVAVEAEARSDALRAVLDRISAHWPDNEAYPFRVRIWNEDEPNALALPGGTIAVTTGLLDAVTSENELAFVLGHELGHFRNRDHLRGMGRGIGLSLLLFSIGVGGAGDAAQLASVAGQLTQRGFDRAQESAADTFGLGLVVAEYGHTEGASDLFEHLRETGEASALAGYLSTHPLHGDRSDRLEAVARAAGWPLRGKRRALDSVLRHTPVPEVRRETGI
jgi:Zn-dependent protease with chaperone function